MAGPPRSRENSDWIAHNPIRLLDGTIRSTPRGYSPAQMRHAYGVDQVAGTGSNQTIAIVDAYGSPTIQNDLDVFCQTYGIPLTTIEIAYPQGKPRRQNRGWALETTLDVEWAHAIAPGAKIMLVVGRSASIPDLLGSVDFAVKHGATQVSMSWGAAERSSQRKFESLFGTPCVSFIASSGDSGAGAFWPASSPNVLAVGGTTLILDTNSVILSEAGWSGSGGGQSRFFPRPAYQNGWHGSTQRGVPDVSYSADPRTGVAIYMSNGNNPPGWTTVGGTSAGAPQVAAMLAIANSSRTTPLADDHQALYDAAAANRQLFFNDIVSGNNGSFYCTAAYDYVTGLGSPLNNLLIPALIGY
ncbi:MAG: S53 family peptidase [bacterium]